MLYTIFAIIIGWNLIDWLAYNLPWAGRLVFFHMDANIWAKPWVGESSDTAAKRQLWLSALATSVAAVLFILLAVWLGLVGASLLQGLIFGFLLWLALAVPLVLQELFCFNVTWRFSLLYAGAWLVKLVLGGAILSLIG